MANFMKNATLNIENNTFLHCLTSCDIVMKETFLNYAQFVMFDFFFFNFCNLISFTKFSKPLLGTHHPTVPRHAQIGKNPKLAFYCRNQKFGSILEGGNHSQLFLKPRITLFLLLLWAVLTLFFQFLQFSIGKKHISIYSAGRG